MLQVRATQRAYAVSNAPTEAPTAASSAQVQVYSYDAGKGHDIKVLGRPTNDPVAQAAYDNTVRVLDYYRQTFGRNSFDNKGTAVGVRVHAPDAQTGQANANNAYWFNDEGRMWFGDGDGHLFSPLGSAADVVAHEFTHGVVASEVKLDAWGQSAALNESWADVMATGIDGNWKIGEDVFTPGTSGDALRDLENPKYRSMSELPEGESEEHELANIPNHAAFKTAQRVGGDAMRKIWYTALTGKLQNNAGFAGARDATIAAAQQIYGASSKEAAAVRDAWTAVGITERTHKTFWTPQDSKRFDVRDVQLVTIG